MANLTEYPSIRHTDRNDFWLHSAPAADCRFVAEIVHELGAPLTRMHLALAILQRQLGEQRSQELARIERETHKLSKLAEQLLLLAGLKAGRGSAEALEPVSTQWLCESIVEDAHFEAAHNDCHISVSCQEVMLLVYPQILRRAIDNVLRNAIRYTPAGTEIRFVCRATEDLKYLILEIMDSGPGVPESMLSEIFRPFFRIAPRESKIGGTGLGLAIASEAIELHGGSISARNRETGGLQVTIALPMRSQAPKTVLQNHFNRAGVSDRVEAGASSLAAGEVGRTTGQGRADGT